MNSRLVVLGSVLGFLVATSAVAQVPDHLQCYKIKDASIILKGTVDLLDQLSGPRSPCKISSAKMYCRASTKSNANVLNVTAPIVPLAYTGVEIADDQDRLCYKVSCPNLPAVADIPVVTDQFGQHNLTKLKTGMLCTPASIGASYCGDGIINGIEDCDGITLGGASCVSVGYGSGTLACGPGCRFDVGACTAGAFPATGQTTCYQTAGGGVIACGGTGQDGQNQAGATLAYQDNGDGTVTDLNTGLIWEKQSDDGSINDRDQTFTFATAPTHIAALNGATFAGYTDWRLPNIRELQSLVNYGVANPAITSSVFHTNCFGGCTVAVCSCTAFAHHWSGTTAPNLTTAALTMNFTDGNMGVFTKNGANAFPVRGVRGGPQ